MSKCIHHEGGSKKYVLDATYTGFVPFFPSENIVTEYAYLTTDGWIEVYKDYEWDGASGPTIDTDDTMDGSLVHDILYQLIRERVLPYSYRKAADICIRKMCIKDGLAAVNRLDVSEWRKVWRRAAVRSRFNYWYFFLRIAGGSAAKM